MVPIEICITITNISTIVVLILLDVFFSCTLSRIMEALYNSVVDVGARDTYTSRINQDSCFSELVDGVLVREVQEAILGQKKGKSSGPDSLAMEAFMYGNTRLHVHLSLYFTFCIKHG